MSDELDHFFQCLEIEGGWQFQVGIVVWHDSHTPALTWKTYRRWRTPPTERRLQKARAAALVNPRFFRRCARCNERHNTGHMFGHQICNGCAEKHLGIVY